MNITAAARTFGLSRRTLYNWMDAGFLAFTLAKGSRQVRSEDVQVCVASKWKRLTEQPTAACADSAREE